MLTNDCCAGGAVKVSISNIADQPEPICVTVTNCTGRDVNIKVVREPGIDTNFRVFGRPGEEVTSVKTYSVGEGVNSVKVFQGPRLLSERTITV